MFKLRFKRTTAPTRNLCSPVLLLLPALLLGATADGALVPTVTLCEGAGCDMADVRYQGTTAAQFGFSAAVGYLDGDLLADLVVGAPGEGRVYVFFGGIDQGQESGNASWPELLAGTADVILATQSSTTRFGFSVAVGLRSSAGDLSNQVIVGAPGVDKAFVIDVAGASGTVVVDGAAPPVPVREINGPAGSATGHSVALGPVLLAGGDDYVIGARTAGDDAGAVWAVQRTASTTIDLEPATAGLTMVKFTGSASREGLGEYLVVATLLLTPADTEQVAISAVGTAPSDTDNIPGRVYLVEPEAFAVAGSSVTVSLASVGTARVIEGDSAKLSGVPAGTNDFFGFSMAAGDFDDDGLPDLAVGAIYADRSVGECATNELNSGAVYFFNSLDISGLSTDPANPTPAGAFASRVFWGHRRWDELGFSVASGDVNGDGVDDLLASARRADRDQTDYNEVNEGAVYVVHGSPEFAALTAHTCLDCPTAACDALPAGVDAAIFGGDYADSLSEEVGFFVAAGDFNRSSLYDEVLVTSLVHGRAYLVSLNNGDLNEDEDGQETDTLRDVADDDDDGDGYLDTEEDANANGVFEPGLSESDTLTPNRDVTVSTAAAGGNTLNCAGTVEVTVTVSNVGRRLTVLDPRLRIGLPGAPFAYVTGSTVIVRQGVTTPVVDGAGGTFPFATAFRSITADGSPRTTDPLAATPQGQAPAAAAQIQVVFELEATLPLPYDTPNTGIVSADVELDPADNELPETGLGQTNSAQTVVTLLRPDLVIAKGSSDVDGGILDPEDVIHYTITVANDGPRASAAAGNVVLTDVLPADLLLDGGSVTTSQGTVTSTDPLTVSIGTIGDGASVTVEFNATVSELATHGLLLENQATASETCFVDRISDSTDPADNDALELGNDPADPADDDTTKDTVTVSPGILLAKVADVAVARVGDPVVYTYTVENTGNVKLKNVDVSDTKCAPVTQTDNGDGNAFLNPDEIWTYTCTYTVLLADLPGPLVNNATATGETPVGDAYSDTASASVDLAAIALSKTGNPSPAPDGSTVTYTFVASNSGVFPMENVVLADSDPACDADLAFIGGDVDSDGHLGVGENWTWECQVTAVAPGPLLNTGTVTADLLGVGTSVSDTADATVFVGAVTLTKVGAPNPVVDGAPLTYTFTAANVGTVDLENVVLADSDATCNADLTPLGGDADSDGVLDVGETWTWDCEVAAAAPGPIVNTGTVTADMAGTATPVSDTAIESVDVGGATLTKTGTPNPVANGATVTYTFAAANSGGIDLQNVALADSDPVCDAGLTFLGGDADSDTVLDVGETWTWDCQVTAVAPGPMNNTGTLTAELVGTGAPVTALSAETVNVGAIGLNKVGAPNPVADGASLTYTFTAVNAGTADLENVLLSDSDTTCDGGLAFLGGDADSDNVLDLGEAWTWDCTVTAAAPSPIVNTGTVAAELVGTGAPVSADAVETVNIGGITLAKTGAPDPVADGAPVTYTFSAANSGAVDLQNVLLVDSDPSCNGTLAFLGGDADTDGLLDVGELWTWDCTVTAAAPGPLVNTGTVTADLVGIGVPVAGNALETVQVGAILLTKIGAPNPVDDGMPLSYMFSAINGGTVDLEAVLLTDSDPACNASLIFLGGDMNFDGLLNVGELWDWNCTVIAVGPGPIVNTGTVMANLVGGGPPVLATADETVDVNPPPAPPVIEPSLRLGPGGVVEWTVVTAAVNYHFYRGDLRTLQETGVYTQDASTPQAEKTCWLAGTSYDDGYVPEPGRPVFYLVTSDEGSTESDLGKNSGGVTRPNDNPCR